MTNQLSKYFVSKSTIIRQVIDVIDKGAAQVALVVGSDRRLLGIVTDGDVRRGILTGFSLDDAVEEIMTKKPMCLPAGSSNEDAISLMKSEAIHHVPVIDEEHRIVDLVMLDDLLKKPALPNSVVIMAGGKGERLRPLTDNCPKPMLKIGDKPILEIILEQCMEAGLSNFYISVNYLKEQIIDHFGSGDKWGIEIHYLEETQALGTAGSLSLLSEIPKHDILTINGDVVTNLNLDRLLRSHCKSNNLMTVCTRSHRVRIPFAVMTSSRAKLESFVEKPMYDFQVNAGVYILKPSLIEKIPAEFYNMTDLVDDLLKSKLDVGVFPIHENWKDIGDPIDFKEAQSCDSRF